MVVVPGQGNVAGGPVGARWLVESTTEGMTLHDSLGVVIEANEAAAALLGISRDRLIGRDLLDPVWHLRREDESELAPHEHPALVSWATHEPCRDVIVGVDHVGVGRRWLTCSAFPLFEDDRLAAVSVHLVDVTTVVQREHELRATNERLALVMRYPADVVVLASRDAIGEWASDSITDLLGLAPSEVVGRRIDSFVHPDDLGRIVDFRRLAPDARSAQFLVRLRRKDGEYRWIAISARRVNASDGTERIVSSWRDAQALVEANRDLESTRERFRFLAENATDIVAETDEGFNLTWVSPSMFDVLGWRPADIMGQPLSSLVVSEDRPAVLYEQANVAAGLGPHTLKSRFLTSSGSLRWMAARSRAKLNDVGAAVSYMVSLRDVHSEETFRRELETSEERYRLLADNGADLVMLLSPDHTIRWASPSASELFGWSPQELLGENATHYVHPDDLATLREQPEIYSRGSLTVDALRWRRSNGDYAWVSGRGRDIRDDRDELQARVITLRDISRQVTAEESLAQSEALFRLVLENQADVTARLDPDGIVEWITPSIVDLVGWRAEETIGKNVADFIHSLDSPGLEHVIESVVAGNVEHYEARVHTVTGGVKWVSATAKPLVDETGRTTGSIVNVSDVSRQREAVSLLARSEERFRLALECAPIGMALVDLDRRFLVVNSAMCEMVGRTSQWLLTHRVDDILDPGDESDMAMWADATTGRVIHSLHEGRMRRPDDTTVWVEHSIGLLRDEEENPTGFVSTFVNVTSQRAAKERLRYQATHDTLTHLVNRRDLYRRAEILQHRTTRSGERVGVLYVDIDGFKEVNDDFGHHTGDLALRAVAAQLIAVGRSEDVVSRVGGDEFVILLPSLHRVEDAHRVARKVLARFTAPLRIDGVTLTLGVSIGVALAQPDETPDDTLRRADAALYQAKLRGRGQCVLWRPEFDAPTSA